MNLLKRIRARSVLAFVLAVSMVLTLMPAVTFAANGYTMSGTVATVTSDAGMNNLSGAYYYTSNGPTELITTDGVTEVYTEGLYLLRKITVASTVTSMLMMDTSNVTEIVFEGNTPPSNIRFWEATGATAYVPAGSEAAYEAALSGKAASVQIDPNSAPVHTHTPGEAVQENAVAATCTAQGSYDSVVYCTECGEELSRETVYIERIAHTYANGACTVCGAADPNYTPPETPGTYSLTAGAASVLDGSGNYRPEIYINGSEVWDAAALQSLSGGEFVEVHYRAIERSENLEWVTFTADYTLNGEEQHINLIGPESFTMPAADVTITAVVQHLGCIWVNTPENGTLSLTTEDGALNFRELMPGRAFAYVWPGKTVAVTAQPAAGYKLDTLTVSGAEEQNGSFAMPTSDVTVSAVFAADHEHSYTKAVTKQQTLTEKGVYTYTCECGDSYTEEFGNAIADKGPFKVFVSDKAGNRVEIASWTYIEPNGDSKGVLYDDATGQILSIFKDFTDPVNQKGVTAGYAYDVTGLGCLAYAGVTRKPVNPTRQSITVTGLLMEDLIDYAEALSGRDLRGQTQISWTAADGSTKAGTMVYDSFYAVPRYYYPQYYIDQTKGDKEYYMPYSLAVVGFQAAQNEVTSLEQEIGMADSLNAIRNFQGQITDESGAIVNDGNLGGMSTQSITGFLFEPVYYTITVADAEETGTAGTDLAYLADGVTVTSADHYFTAAKGETVSLTIQGEAIPAVTDAEGHEVEYTFANGELTFTMPAGNVSIALEAGETEHVWGSPEWNWTETEDGYTAEAVFVCENDESHVDTVEALVVRNDSESTCSKAGTAYYVAFAAHEGKSFFDSKHVSLEPLAHTPGEAVVENETAAVSCAEPGSYDRVIYCTVCKEEISRETVPAAGDHLYWENGFCSVCGIYNPETEVYTVTTAAQLAEISRAAGAGDGFAGKTVLLAQSVDLSAAENFQPIGGAVSRTDLTIGSQAELDAALDAHILIYDNTGASYVRGSDKNQNYDAGRTYYYQNGSAFAGIFDGQGNEVTGLNIQTNKGYAGLFGDVSGTVKNLTVRGTVASTTTQDFVGGIAGKLSAGGLIDSCVSYVTVSSRGFNTGGVVGMIGEMGMLVSETNPIATVRNCAFYGSVTSAERRTGGIAGRNAGLIESCANHGQVSTSYARKNGVGGICGWNGVNNAPTDAGIVRSCYTDGDVDGNTCFWTGGIVGFQNAKSVLENSYNASLIKNAKNPETGTFWSFTNSVMGQNEGTITDVLWLNKEIDSASDSYLGMDSTGVGNSGGRVTNVTGVTEEQLKGSDVLAVLDPEGTGIWKINCGGFPVLSWETGKEHTAAEAVKENVVEAALCTDSGSYDLAVYCADCGTLLSRETVETTGEHAFAENGFCSICGTYNPEAAVYTVTTPAQLAEIARAVNAGDALTGKTVQLGADIDLADYSNWIAIGSSTLNPFEGTFDGKNYAVTNLSITTGAAGYKGLFGYSKGTVKDFSISGSIGSADAYITSGADNIGGAVGWNDGTVSGVKGNVAVFVRAGIYAVGGIVGQNGDDGIITSCLNSADLNVSKASGGIVGRNWGVVTLCKNTGNITGNQGGKDGIGGIAGFAGNKDAGGKDNSITYCCNTGTITNNGGRWHGGIAGFAEHASTITNCYAIGTITPGYSWNWNAVIGHVDSAYSTVHDNYSLDTLTNGDSSASTKPLTVGTQKTESEMKALDFIAVINGEGSGFQANCGGYPALSWEEAKEHAAAEAINENEVPATCTEAGSHEEAVYCSECGGELSRELAVDEAIGHAWAEPEWTWAEAEEGYRAEADFVCENDETHAETVVASILSYEKASHAGAAGVRYYIAIAVHEGKAFTDSKTEDIPYIAVTELTVDPASAEVATKDSLQMNAVITPEDASDQTITWTSSDASIASVDENGLVKAKKYGKVTITAESADGQKASCEIQTRFYDVNNPSKSYFTPVYWAVDNGITRTTVNFNPDDGLTRGEFVAFMYRLEKLRNGTPKTKASDRTFSDVPEGAKFYKEIRWAVGAGIIKGYSDGTFRPDVVVTRSQAATMLCRWAGSPKAKAKTSPFPDVTNPKAESYNAILWGSENGIMKGKGGMFLPGDDCSRADIVTFLYRYNSKF